MPLLLDTCFLIDLERNKPEAIDFVGDADPSEALCISAVSVGEMVCGYDPADVSHLVGRLALFQILDLTVDAALRYGSIYRRLKQAGKMIGSNDLWIASTALSAGYVLVTRNVSEFSRVPGLRVMAY